ncbi:MAG TPA: P-II family nitrogen regulator [Gammaproteobacteria bacterium]|nr:P-II family nitrogen regulator [Gammaproteobacteria bacterium]
MKEIKAYIREAMRDAVVDALEETPGIPGVTVSAVEAYGHPSEGEDFGATRMVRLEVDVADALAPTVVATILERGCTGDGHPGDGKVFVSELAEAYRVSDGASGEGVLGG